MGEFIVINKHLIKDLIELICEQFNAKQNLIRENGQAEYREDPHLKEISQTVWEVETNAS